MRWDDFRRSDNIEDAREGEYSGNSHYDERGGFYYGSGGPGPGFNPMGLIGLLGLRGAGIGTLVVLVLLSLALGIDPSEIWSGGQTISTPSPPQKAEQSITFHNAPANAPPKDRLGDFVAAVLGNTEDTWHIIFQERKAAYQPPRLRLFSGTQQSSCGFARAATGPFYCPADQRIYLDTSFFRDISARFKSCRGKACEFAEAYVIAHEVGHHVQNLLGILSKAQQAQRLAGSKANANRIQVRVELQADCFAGVWANRSNQHWKSIESGDVEAAMQTAAAIGDDRLQQQARGFVIPDSFTHGTSAERQRWFSIGLKEGKLSACNTFAATKL